MSSYTEITPEQIVVNNVSRQKYKDLSTSNQLCADQLYIVKDVQLNAVGLRVINVGAPTDLSDATTKQYVDTEISNQLSNYYPKSLLSTASEISEKFSQYTIVNKVTQAEYDILSATGQLKDDELYVITDAPTTDQILSARLSSYYKKTETSSATQLATEFAKYQPSGDYRTGAQISAIAGAYATSVDNKLTGYYTKAQTDALSTTFRDGLATTASLTAYETKSDLTANYYTKTDTNALSTTFRAGLAATSSLTAYQPSGDYRTGTQISGIASTYALSVKLADYTTSAQASAIANAYATSVDNKLTGYYLKTETSSASQLKTALDGKQITGDYALKATTLTGYGITDTSADNQGHITIGGVTLTTLTAHQSLEAYEPISDLTSNYYTKAQTNALSTTFRNGLATTASLTAYETKSDLTTNYYTKSATSSSNQIASALTALSSGLSSYTDTMVASVAADIPTKVSELENDSGYLTAHQSLTAYETKSDLTTNYYTKTETNSLSTTFRNGLATTASLTAYQVKGNYLSTTSDHTTSAQVSSIASAYALSVKLADYTTSAQASAIASAYAVSVDNKLTGYYTKAQTDALSTTFRAGLAATSSLTAYQPSGDYRTGTQISGIASTYALSVKISDYTTSAQASAIANAYATSVDNKLSGYQTKGNYLLSSNLNFNYNSTSKKIYLSAQGALVGQVDCADFIKDGMLSTVVLTGNILVFTFNTDAGATPISVDLSKFVDNYDTKINGLSNAISTVAEDYTTSAQASAIASAYALSVNNKLSGYYTKTETNNLSTTFRSGLATTTSLSAYQLSGDYKTGIQVSSIAYNYATSVDNKLSGYYTKTETNALSTSFRQGLAATSSLAAYQLSGDYRTGTQVSAIAGAYALSVKISNYTTSAQASAIASAYALSVDNKLTGYETKADLTANYYNKTQANQISTDLSTGIMENTSRVFIRKWSD